MFTNKLVLLLTRSIFSKNTYRNSTLLESNPFSLPANPAAKQIYVFKQEEGYLGYIIKEEKSNSLICVDPGRFEVAIEFVKLMEKQWNSQLSHILCTHNFRMTNDVEKFLSYNKNVQIAAGVKGTGNVFHNLPIKDQETLEIGDLTFTFSHAPGFMPDSHFIFMNHQQKSYPIIFTGETVLLNNIGKITEPTDMLQSIKILKKLENETLIFPSKDISIEDVEFALTTDPGNAFLNVRLHFAKKAAEKKINYVPTQLLEERNANIFFRTNELYFKKQMRTIFQANLIQNLQSLRLGYPPQSSQQPNATV